MGGVYTGMYRVCGKRSKHLFTPFLLFYILFIFLGPDYTGDKAVKSIKTRKTPFTLFYTLLHRFILL